MLRNNKFLIDSYKNELKDRTFLSVGVIHFTNEK